MSSIPMRVWALGIACVAMALQGGHSAFAQASVPAVELPKLAPPDIAFLKQAAAAGLAEIEASRLAVDKGVNTQIKGFAQQMIDDHTKMHAQLRTLASSRGVRLPIEPSLGQRAKVKLLSAADGSSFDRKYADSLGVQAHQDAIKLFQKAAEGASDPAVKSFAEKGLAALQQHLQMARELKGVVDKEGNARAPGDRKQ